jgi:hypothetical protein
MGANEDALRDLLDEQAIRKVVLRYCRGIDRLDRELVRGCYHDDATDEHGSFSGGVDEFMEWAFRVASRYDVTMHFVGNLLVELRAPHSDGRRSARAETYGISHHRRAGGPPESNLLVGFRYVDRFERRGDGAWRIARRVCTTEWVRRDDESMWWPIPPGMRTGRRDRTDPVYEPID